MSSPSLGSGKPSSDVCVNTRVLWDIENVPVPTSLGGLFVVRKLLDFLKELGFAGEGIDCRY